MEMESFRLVLSGSVGTGVLGIIALWIRTRIKHPVKVSPTPLPISYEKEYILKEDCKCAMNEVKEAQKDIFRRLSDTEKISSELRGALNQINDRLSSNDQKLTVILQQIRKGGKHD